MYGADIGVLQFGPAGQGEPASSLVPMLGVSLALKGTERIKSGTYRLPSANGGWDRSQAKGDTPKCRVNARAKALALA